MTTRKIDWSAMAVQAKTSRDVRQWFIVANEQLCKYFANRFRATLDLDDAMQAARMGINRAVELYDPDKGAWGTYAAVWIRSSIIELCRHAPTISGFRRGCAGDVLALAARDTRPIDEEVPCDEEVDELASTLRSDVPSALELMMQFEDDKMHNNLISDAKLSRLERLVVLRLLDGHRQADIAIELDVVRQRVSQLKLRAEKKLRRTAAFRRRA